MFEGVGTREEPRRIGVELTKIQELVNQSYQCPKMQEVRGAHAYP
jgi:hypothetical protein